MIERAPTHGRAPNAWVTVHQITAVLQAHGWLYVQARLAVRCSAVLAYFCLGCTAVHPCWTPIFCTVFLCFAILNAWDFLEPLIFLEIAR